LAKTSSLMDDNSPRSDFRARLMAWQPGKNRCGCGHISANRVRDFSGMGVSSFAELRLGELDCMAENTVGVEDVLGIPCLFYHALGPISARIPALPDMARFKRAFPCSGRDGVRDFADPTHRQLSEILSLGCGPLVRDLHQMQVSICQMPPNVEAQHRTKSGFAAGQQASSMVFISPMDRPDIEPTAGFLLAHGMGHAVPHIPRTRWILAGGARTRLRQRYCPVSSACARRSQTSAVTPAGSDPSFRSNVKRMPHRNRLLLTRTHPIRIGAHRFGPDHLQTRSGPPKAERNVGHQIQSLASKLSAAQSKATALRLWLWGTAESVCAGISGPGALTADEQLLEVIGRCVLAKTRLKAVEMVIGQNPQSTQGQIARHAIADHPVWPARIVRDSP